MKTLGGAVGTLAILLGLMVGPAAAAPGVPEAPKQIYLENFETGFTTGDTSTAVVDTYAGSIYKASVAWKTPARCNGIILSNLSDETLAPFNACPGGSKGSLRALARDLGFFSTGVVASVDPANTGNLNNHALAAYTAGDPSADCDAPANYNAPGRDLNTVPPACNILMETVNAVPLPAGRRYLSGSIDVGVQNCQASDPLFAFSVLNGTTEIPVSAGEINPCPGGTPSSSQPTPNGTGTGGSTLLGRYIAPGAIPFTGASVGVRVRDTQPSGTGNDAAVDNIRLIDATPQLDKAFDVANAKIGDTVRLTFTVTNTSDLAAKSGWSFTDSLPAGMSPAAAPNSNITCTNGTVGITGSQVTVAGDLDLGQASCTASLDVLLTKTGALSNGAANVAVSGVDPPATPATITVGKGSIDTKQTVSKKKLKPGQKTNLNAKVTNTSGATLAVTVCEDLPPGFKFAGSSPKAKKKGGKYCHTFKNVAPGETVKLKVKARAAAGTCGPQTAQADGSGDDVQSDRDRASVRVTCPRRAGGVTG